MFRDPAAYLLLGRVLTKPLLYRFFDGAAEISFLSANTVTTASLSFLSVSSDRTIYILPKVRHQM